MPNIVCFGELLLRLSTTSDKRIVQSTGFNVNYGGAEANVAVSLSSFGMKVTFLTKIPDNEIGTSAKNELNKFGVNTSHIVKGGDRLGIYFLEVGNASRPSKVIYDRANSSFSKSKFSEFDFENIFKNNDWFHVSGVTAALNENTFESALESLKLAKYMGLTTSLDVNYRAKLWSLGKAQEYIAKLCPYVDVCIGVDPTLNIFPSEKNMINGHFTVDGFKEVFVQLKEKYGFKYIATSLREVHSSSENSIAALLYDGNEFYQTKKHTFTIADRVGTGDAFAAGLIYGISNKKKLNEIAEFAIASNVYKHSIQGDFSLASVEEIEALAFSKNLKVQR